MSANDFYRLNWNSAAMSTLPHLRLTDLPRNQSYSMQDSPGLGCGLNTQGTTQASAWFSNVLNSSRGSKRCSRPSQMHI